MFVIRMVLFFVLCGCARMEETEKERLRLQNHQAEYIIRQSSDHRLFLHPPDYRTRSLYPWEGGYIGANRRITKDYFRCKGSVLNPLRIVEEKNGQKNPVLDCGGRDKHSLPLCDGKEFIYPVLIDLLNFVQAKTGKQVIITSGHRCPQHNQYIDPTIPNQTSGHMVGSIVDFYVQGLENRPEVVVEIIKSYYKERPEYQGKKEYEQFLTVQKIPQQVTIPPIYNREISLRIYKRIEGRNLDNRHAYPYISLTVRYDRELKKSVAYSWDLAQRLNRS